MYIEYILDWGAPYWEPEQVPSGIERPPLKRAKPTDFPAVDEGACCANGDRDMNGGCRSCGDPCL